MSVSKEAVRAWARAVEPAASDPSRPNVSRVPAVRGSVQAVGPEAVVRRRRDGRHRHLRGRQSRRQGVVERQTLERVVGLAGDVEVAPHPAGAGLGVQFADLPVVAAREVALVGGVVADRREHRHLAFSVQLREPGRLWVPHQGFVLGERHPFAFLLAQLGAQLVVGRFLDRGQHRQRVPAAFHEDRHDHRLLGRRRGGGLGDPRFEVSGRQRRRSVDGEHPAGGAQQERAAAHAGPGRERHPPLDRRQPAAGLGHPRPQHLRARELPARAAACHPGQLTCMSGEVAISIRSAFWRMAR